MLVLILEIKKVVSLQQVMSMHHLVVLNTDLQAGFKNENFNIGYTPQRGLNYGFNKQFGDNTNLDINQSGAQLGTQFGDNTNINFAYNNGNFNPY